MTMSIWERTDDALTPLGVPMAQNVYLVGTGGDYPDQFMVYSMVVDTPELHADNAEVLTQKYIQVSIYDRNGLANLPNVTGAMLAAGFTRGPARELPYSEATRHFGLAMDFYYLEDV